MYDAVLMQATNGAANLICKIGCSFLGEHLLLDSFFEVALREQLHDQINIFFIIEDTVEISEVPM